MSEQPRMSYSQLFMFNLSEFWSQCLGRSACNGSLWKANLLLQGTRPASGRTPVSGVSVPPGNGGSAHAIAYSGPASASSCSRAAAYNIAAVPHSSRSRPAVVRNSCSRRGQAGNTSCISTVIPTVSTVISTVSVVRPRKRAADDGRGGEAAEGRPPPPRRASAAVGAATAATAIVAAAARAVRDFLIVSPRQ